MTTSDKIKALQAQGVTCWQMSKRLGCKVTTVTRWRDEKTKISNVYKEKFDAYFDEKNVTAPDPFNEHEGDEFFGVSAD